MARTWSWKKKLLLIVMIPFLIFLLVVARVMYNRMGDLYLTTQQIEALKSIEPETWLMLAQNVEPCPFLGENPIPELISEELEPPFHARAFPYTKGKIGADIPIDEMEEGDGVILSSIKPYINIDGLKVAMTIRSGEEMTEEDEFVYRAIYRRYPLFSGKKFLAGKIVVIFADTDIIGAISIDDALFMENAFDKVVDYIIALPEYCTSQND